MYFLYCVVLFFLVNPVSGQSSRLTENFECIPGVLRALDSQINYDVAVDVRSYFKAFSSEKSFLSQGHVVWRLMAALRAAGCGNLYKKILNQSHARDNTLLNLVGHKWDGCPMNEWEEKVLQKPENLENQTFIEAYSAQWFKDLETYWGFSTHDEILVKDLPHAVWPTSLLKKEAQKYVDAMQGRYEARQRSFERSETMLRSCEDLCRRFGPQTTDQMRERIDLLLYLDVRDYGRECVWESLCLVDGSILTPFGVWATSLIPEVGHPYNYYLMQLMRACEIVGEKDLAAFKSWFEVMTEGGDGSEKGESLYSLSDVWQAFKGKPSDAFVAWVDMLVLADAKSESGGRIYSRVDIMADWIDVWNLLEGKPCDQLNALIRNLTKDMDQFTKIMFFSGLRHILIAGQDQPLKVLQDWVEAVNQSKWGDPKYLPFLANVWPIIKGEPSIEFKNFFDQVIGGIFDKDDHDVRHIVYAFIHILKKIRGEPSEIFMRWVDNLVPRENLSKSLFFMLNDVVRMFDGEPSEVFMLWVSEITDGMDRADKETILSSVNLMLMALKGKPSEAFMLWISEITGGVDEADKKKILSILNDMLVELKGEPSEAFMLWVSSTLIKGNKYDKESALQDLNSLLRVLKSEPSHAFMMWATSLISKMESCRSQELCALGELWQAFNGKPTEAFMTWAKKWVPDENDVCLFASLTKVWTFKDGNFHADFTDYSRSINIANIGNQINSYLSHSYARLLRAQSAWESEGSPQNQGRRQHLIEVTQDYRGRLLPLVIQGQNQGNRVDQRLADIRREGIADTHDFENDIYPHDYTLLAQETQNVDLSTSSDITLYDNRATRNHKTNVEVIDFLSFMDSDFVSDEDNKKADVVRQILGLKQSSNPFGSYLGHAMYLGGRGASGDEFLGRVWAHIKVQAANKCWQLEQEGRAGEGAHEKQVIHRSVVLALVDAAEIINGVAELHCQTRTTGELMKCLSWYLKDSKLKPFIAGIDEDEPESEQTIKAQIFNATSIANRLIKNLEGGEGRNFKALIQIGDQELWRLYKALYDDFYGRTYQTLVLKDKKTGEELVRTSYQDWNDAIKEIDSDITVMVGFEYLNRDEHLLERDMGTGALVSKWDANGLQRQTPVVKWAQEPFRYIEHVFSQMVEVTLRAYDQ